MRRASTVGRQCSPLPAPARKLAKVHAFKAMLSAVCILFVLWMSYSSNLLSLNMVHLSNKMQGQDCFVSAQERAGVGDRASIQPAWLIGIDMYSWQGLLENGCQAMAFGPHAKSALGILQQVGMLSSDDTGKGAVRSQEPECCTACMDGGGPSSLA